ncbi:hypothetical protein D3C80_482750 [compost metagenome]
MLAKVLQDAAHRVHARLFIRRINNVWIGLAVPIKNAPYERRDQISPHFSAGPRLDEVEDQRQVALDAVRLQHFRSTHAFPGGGQFDQDAVPTDTGLFVQLDQAPGLGNTRHAIEGKTGIHFGRHASRHKLKNLFAHRNHQAVAGFINGILDADAQATHVTQDLFDQSVVLTGLHCLQNQRRVGGRILRRKAADRVEIAGIGYHNAVLSQLFKQVGHFLGSC